MDWPGMPCWPAMDCWPLPFWWAGISPGGHSLRGQRGWGVGLRGHRLAWRALLPGHALPGHALAGHVLPRDALAGHGLLAWHRLRAGSARLARRDPGLPRDTGHALLARACPAGPGMRWPGTAAARLARLRWPSRLALARAWGSLRLGNARLRRPVLRQPADPAHSAAVRQGPEGCRAAGRPAAGGLHGLALDGPGRLTPRQRGRLAARRLRSRELRIRELGGGGLRARLRRALVLGYHRGGVDRGRGGMRTGGQCLLAERADDRAVPVGQRAGRGHGQLVGLLAAERVRSGHELGKGPQVPVANLDDVVAFLAEAAGNGPVAAHGDVHDRHPDAEILHVRDDLGQVFLGADQEGVADRVVAGQGGQVAADLALHALAPARPGPAQPQLQPGKICQRVVLGRPAALDGSLIPVAAQQRAAGSLPGDAAHERQQAGVVPGYGLPVAGSVDGHRAIRQHVARVHEQRAPIHATPSFPRRVTLPAPSQPRDGSREVAGPPRPEKSALGRSVPGNCSGPGRIIRHATSCSRGYPVPGACHRGRSDPAWLRRHDLLTGAERRAPAGCRGTARRPYQLRRPAQDG